MQKSESKLTVFFDEPFWFGVYERMASLNGMFANVIKTSEFML